MGRKITLQQFEIDYIKENADTLTIKQMADAIGCSYTIVSSQCKRLKITPIKSYFQNGPPVILPVQNANALSHLKAFNSAVKRHFNFQEDTNQNH